ncbi:hypothetical protein EG347_05055 [Chryseobacterium sp. G0186]|uniref:hypothetical protein n=1 Tax=Chryseobacterium sp. G0186 TaxID=2487064 RepID=UPI000F4E4A0F|nr:hypothetical protein [Chryseobacterium sp. G0186]AZA76921.1 hypothetical protein EG347_05055 [Chryseobacterium sp. G0186]
MKYLSFLLLIILIGCKKTDKRTETTETNVNHVNAPTYKELLASINNKTKKEKKAYFFSFIHYDVPRYWSNTPWSFSGTSQEPRKGSIACGYFVTNTLSDYGFDINRTYLAQQASSVMIKKLCKDIQYFNKRQDLEKYIVSKDKNQVYIVGLDFHTGYITRENRDTYFIHSSYIQSKGVVKELTKNSQALNASKTYMIGTLNY